LGRGEDGDVEVASEELEHAGLLVDGQLAVLDACAGGAEELQVVDDDQGEVLVLGADSASAGSDGGAGGCGVVVEDEGCAVEGLVGSGDSGPVSCIDGC